jgi:hypothetical protein
MPRTPTLTLTGLLIEAAQSMAETRRRVAQKAAGEIMQDRAAGKDVRSAAVKVTELLGQADTLQSVADQLAAGSLALTPRVGEAEGTSHSLQDTAASLDLGIADDDDLDDDPDVIEVDLTGGP